MALTLTVPQLLSALRMGSTTEETQEATRLLSYATTAIEKYLGDAYEDTPEAVVNEASIRWTGYLFDMPFAARGSAFASAITNSGAGAILLPYRVHRAGSVAEAVSAAQAAIGSTGNPVTDVQVSGSSMTIVFADGTTRDETLPAGMGGGPLTDQEARDAAASAATTASNAATAASNARDAAAAAQGTANNAATAATAAVATANANTGRLDAFPAGTGGVDQPARDAADGAQGTAAAAQARADDAYTLADGKVDPAGAASAAREVTADWAEAENPDPIPAPKLVNVVNAHEDIVNVLDGRLPGLPVAMRLGWSQTRTFTELDFDRPLPPVGGSVAGLSDRLAAPPFPPGLASDPTLFFGIWLAGDPDVVEISGAGAQFGGKRPLSINTGKVGGEPGHYVVSTARLSPIEGTILSVTISGPRIILESDLVAHVSDPVAHHTPPAGMGGGPAVLYEAASVAIAASTGLIAGNVVCPPAGALEFYFEGLTGTRQGGVAFARIPAERVRGAVSALTTAYSNDTTDMLLISHGANRGLGVAVQATTYQIQLAAQAPGNYFVRIVHLEG